MSVRPGLLSGCRAAPTPHPRGTRSPGDARGLVLLVLELPVRDAAVCSSCRSVAWQASAVLSPWGECVTGHRCLCRRTPGLFPVFCSCARSCCEHSFFLSTWSEALEQGRCSTGHPAGGRGSCGHLLLL